MPTQHTAILEDPLSGELYLHGRAVAVSRLVRFKYPSDWVNEVGPAAPQQHEINQFRLGDHVAIEPHAHKGRVHIALVDTVYQDQGLLEVHLMHVPPDSRFGPWQRRPWTFWPTKEGHPKVEVVPVSEVLCKVTLQERALDLASLTTLAHLGVDVGSTPHRDRSLPPQLQQTTTYYTQIPGESIPAR